MKAHENAPPVVLHTSEPPSRARNVAGRGVLVAGLAAVGFLGYVGGRVTSAVDAKGASATQQQQVATRAAVQAEKPPEVRPIRGTTMSWQPRVSFEGTLSPQREADLGFKTPGRLATIRVKVGDKVRAGQVLATLDPVEAGAQLQAAEAQAQAADAQAQLAADAERRTSAVVASGAQSEAAGVQARQQKRLAEAQRDAARAQAALARTALANHTLTAPFAGTVTRVPPAPGAVVAPGTPLFHVADLSTLKLVGAVGEHDAGYVKIGAPVEVIGRGSDVIAKGKIVAVVPALDVATRRVPVEATIDNSAGASETERLFAGALVRANVTGGAPVAVLSLPPTVLRPGSQDEVLVVNGDRIAVRKVEHAVAADGNLLVRRGLAPNDQIVAAAWAEAQNGQKVTVAAGGREEKR